MYIVSLQLYYWFFVWFNSEVIKNNNLHVCPYLVKRWSNWNTNGIKTPTAKGNFSFVSFGSPRQRSLGLLVTSELFYHLTVRLVIWFQLTFLIIQWKRESPYSNDWGKVTVSILTNQIGLLKSSFVNISQIYL